MRTLAVCFALFCAAPTIATLAFAGGIPAPVAGISFDEWAAGNARIVKGETLADVRKVLGVSAVDWARAETAFTEALRNGSPDDAAFTRMGEVYAHPTAGRFHASPLPEMAPNQLKTYEDWARVQAHLISANDAHADMDAALAEHGLTTAEWADQARPWVEVLKQTELSPWTPARVALQERRAAILQAFLDEYDQRYGKGRTPYP